ncbi:hypothetical protein GIB67_039573 [Kingdonia uniflora]|uniref:CASP-like protein n=1 Tax=Kingdonia uniflora TaxID=39325 RepID=A0A7J7P6F2_9MAGN|nr:hypothetical protein GIB67_039573 [Kingdonia uniflora]
MKDLPGTPGTLSGLFLRFLQCLFASLSIMYIASTANFIRYTVYRYLAVAMSFQLLWSLSLACLDVYSMVTKNCLHDLVRLFATGDWLTALLSLAASSSSAGVTILFYIGGCSGDCTKYQMAIFLAFMSWITIETSALIMFWLLISG